MVARSNNEKNSTRKPKASNWIAVASLAFGIVQFAITLYLNQLNKSLERDLEEANKLRTEINFYEFNHDGLGTLIERLRSPGGVSTDKRPFSVVMNENDETPDKENRLGGWPSFKQIHARAAKDPVGQRDQRYWFMAVENKGSKSIDEVHIAFEEDKLGLAIRNLGPGQLVFAPIEVYGKHAYITRTKKLTPVEAWYVYKSTSQKDKKIPIELKKGTLHTALWEGVRQALPNF